jgi:hypothetical protein
VFRWCILGLLAGFWPARVEVASSVFPGSKRRGLLDTAFVWMGVVYGAVASAPRACRRRALSSLDSVRSVTTGPWIVWACCYEMLF